MKFLEKDDYGWEGIDYEGTVLDKNDPEESEMLALLIAEDVLYVSYPKIYAVVSDVFYWGTADLEQVKTSQDLRNLFEEHIADEMWGTVKWAMKQRAQRPQERLMERMKEEARWESWMDE